MWQKSDVSNCVMMIEWPFVFGLRKLLLLFYGGLFAFWPGGLSASGLRLRVSPVFRSSLRLQYRGTSCSSGLSLADFMVISDHFAEIDDLSYGDRTFVDGYVHQDAGTGKPETILPDSTWNWGYHYASQYDADKQTLTFRKPVQVRQESVERIGENSGAERKKDRVNEQCGLEFAVEIPLPNNFSPISSLAFGWQLVPFWREQSKFSSFQATYQHSDSLLEGEDHYFYSTYGTELPPPGHAGSFEGPFADPPTPGALIANRPSSVQRILAGNAQVLASEESVFRNQVRIRLDCQQQEFWFGPAFRWLPFSWLSCVFSPRCNLLYNAVELKREEKLWQSSSAGWRELRGNWRHKRDAQRLLAGASISCAIESDWENGFFAGLNLSTSWYPEKLELRAGPGSVSLRAGTFCAGAIIGYRF
jgi:hypothetical protein